MTTQRASSEPRTATDRGPRQARRPFTENRRAKTTDRVRNDMHQLETRESATGRAKSPDRPFADESREPLWGRVVERG